MPVSTQKTAAKKFAEYWKNKGCEKGESQKFWIDLLANVYGVTDIAGFISFEAQVKLDHTSFIDGFIPSTHILIEQKGLGKDLRKGIKQSDGSVLSPFQQAKRYAAELPYSRRPRWIITCNFAEFLVYDMEKPNSEPEQILLENLPSEFYRLQFIIDTRDEHIKKEMEVSLQADELVDVQDSVPDLYQSGAVWIMSKQARSAIRKLKDGDGNFLLNKDATTKWGYTLFGKPVYISDAVDGLETGKTPIYYGDFSGLAVKVSEGLSLQLLLEKYATQHVIGAVAWLEMDAKVENTQKIARLVMA